MIPEADIKLAEEFTGALCPNCGGSEVSMFYEVRNVPVHSVLLMPTREAALKYPRGDIQLGFCGTCSFVGNLAFDAGAHSYSTQYEETQGFSPTFQTFHRALAQSLIDRYDVTQKHVMEIGCGKGEFLSLLCEMGNNTGIGFDPAFVPERNPAASSTNVKFIQEFYTEACAGYSADVICCKMTLEHIPDTRRFIQMVRDSIGTRNGTLVFFQVPDFGRILRDNAFWDIYYEHCSYLTEASLRYLFESCGFEVLRIETQYDEQYLQIFARASDPQASPRSDEDEVAIAQDGVQRFVNGVTRKIRAWNDMLSDVTEMGRRIVLWGSGSKAVAFLSAMQHPERIEYAVDINPYRHNHYIPGTGQRIVGPEFLAEYKPEIVIAMNAIYREEIDQMLHQVGCTARLLTV